MTEEQIIKQAERISRLSPGTIFVVQAQEFLRSCVGEHSDFYKQMSKILPHGSKEYLYESAFPIIHSFIDYVKNGLLNLKSLKREAQSEVVSDYLSQAQDLLQDEKVQPAAPAVLIGASLEEFLRNWIENEEIELEGKKPCIDTYQTLLYKSKLINKQDVKDIISIAGLRNHAAHGEWEDVGDRQRISTMLDLANLIMRKYS